MDFKPNTNINYKRWNIVSWNPKKKNNFIQISQEQREIRWTQVPLRNTMELIHLHVLPIYAMEDTSYSSVIRMIIRKN